MMNMFIIVTGLGVMGFSTSDFILGLWFSLQHSHNNTFLCVITPRKISGNILDKELFCAAK